MPLPQLPGGWSLVGLSREETFRLCLLLIGEHDLFMYKGLNKPKDNSKGSAKMLLSFFFFLYILMDFFPGALFAIPLVAKSACYLQKIEPLVCEIDCLNYTVSFDVCFGWSLLQLLYNCFEGQFELSRILQQKKKRKKTTAVSGSLMVSCEYKTA